MGSDNRFNVQQKLENDNWFLDVNGICPTPRTGSEIYFFYFFFPTDRARYSLSSILIFLLFIDGVEKKKKKKTIIINDNFFYSLVVIRTKNKGLIISGLEAE